MGTGTSVLRAQGRRVPQVALRSMRLKRPAERSSTRPSFLAPDHPARGYRINGRPSGAITFIPLRLAIEADDWQGSGACEQRRKG
jgi:hypothetical protein